MNDEVSQIDSAVEDFTEEFNGVLRECTGIYKHMSQERGTSGSIAEHEKAERRYASVD